jgi:hypothetical protein
LPVEQLNVLETARQETKLRARRSSGSRRLICC